MAAPARASIPFLKIAQRWQLVAVNQGGKRKPVPAALTSKCWHNRHLRLPRTAQAIRATSDAAPTIINTANWIPDLFMKRMEAGARTGPCSAPTDVARSATTLFGKRVRGEVRRAMRRQARRPARSSCSRSIAGAGTLETACSSMLFETGHPWITFKDPCECPLALRTMSGVIHSSESLHRDHC